MTAGIAEPFVISARVDEALVSGRGVVALETSVLAQGLPPPYAAIAAERMSRAIEAAGAVPAWIGVERGAVRVGLDEGGLEAFAEGAVALKVARRDLPVVLARGDAGATTVSATVWASERAGIAVAATGGIGGVHPAGGDVSADLHELARTPVLLVCSGPKSIVDPLATAERLEELGVSLVGYRCDRMPFFLAAAAPVPLEHRVEDPGAAAALVRAGRRLGSSSAIVLCNPVPAHRGLDAHVVAADVRACQDRAVREGVRGTALTPFLLRCLAERTGGASLEANLALLEANASLAGEVAAAVASDGTPATGARSS